jgi:hypothetical protein
MKPLFVLLYFLFFGLIGSAQSTEKDEFIYTREDTITGQIHTAELLRTYMNNKEYEKAIGLFSAEEQQNIREGQKDTEKFQYWCLAWTLDSKQLERYISMIKKGQAPFVFEVGIWKIDER